MMDLTLTELILSRHWLQIRRISRLEKATWRRLPYSRTEFAYACRGSWLVWGVSWSPWWYEQAACWRKWRYSSRYHHQVHSTRRQRFRLPRGIPTQLARHTLPRARRNRLPHSPRASGRSAASTRYTKRAFWEVPRSRHDGRRYSPPRCRLAP